MLISFKAKDQVRVDPVIHGVEDQFLQLIRSHPLLGIKKNLLENFSFFLVSSTL